MSRYLGPRLRIVRRLGYLIGLTRKKPSTKLLNPEARRGVRKVIPPGQHGRSKSFKKKPYESNEYDYLIRLKLKQRIRYHYGITEKQLVNYVRQARKIKGSTGRVLLRLLEMRLDNTVFRLHMAPTIRAARQLINHGHIYVNNKKITIPSYSCKPKDIITPAPKKRSIELLNNYLTELDQEKSRFKNILKILKFGKKGLLTTTKTLQNTRENNNKKNYKPNTILSLRIQKAGLFDGQGIGFLGKNVVIVQPLFGNIKNYLGKSINICIYLKRENIFYAYPIKPFNIKMRYSRLINSIDAIQYFGRKKTLQNTQNKEFLNSVESNKKTLNSLNKPSSAIIVLGGANIFRNKMTKNTEKIRQNSSDTLLVRIEAASFGKNNQSVLNRKRQLNPFLLNKTRDGNPILFREKYLYSRKNRRFVGINHIFYVKTILKSIEQNATNSANLSIFYERPKKENKNSNLINVPFQNNIIYSNLSKINKKNIQPIEKIINNHTYDGTKNSLIFKDPSLFINNILTENPIKLRKYFLSKIKKQHTLVETKLSLLSLCIKNEKSQKSLIRGKSEISLSSKNILNLKQKTLKNLLSELAIQKNLHPHSFWNILYLFSKISLKKNKSALLSLFSSFKKNFLQNFSKTLIDQKKDFSNKNKVFSMKAFVFFSNIFSLVEKWKTKGFIDDSIFQIFVKNMKKSLNLIILLQKSILSFLKTNQEHSHSSSNLESNIILEYYQQQQYEILKDFKNQIQSSITINQFEKQSNFELLNSFINKNQFCKILELNKIKQELNSYLLLISNKKIFQCNLSYNIDILNYANIVFNNNKFLNSFFIYRNYVQNSKNIIKKELYKSRFELQILKNLFKKTRLFSNFNFERSSNIAFLQKQIVEKFYLIQKQYHSKKLVLGNFLNTWENSGFISKYQHTNILVKIKYYLSQDSLKKYQNLLFNLIQKNDIHINNKTNQILLNKIQSLIILEKNSQNLFIQNLEYSKILDKMENLGLIVEFDKNQLINFINNRVNVILKCLNFEKNNLITKLVSNSLKRKISNEIIIKFKNTIYLTKIEGFSSMNSEKVKEKLKQQILSQKIKQKIKFLSITKKYENVFNKNISLSNNDINAQYIINFFAEIFHLKEQQYFEKIDQTNITFYPRLLNQRIIKEKIIQLNQSWLNFISIFNKINNLYKENLVTKKDYSILIHQTKQFVIKQLILNKNKSFIGYKTYLTLGQKNINYFINGIKTSSFTKDYNFELFKFSYIQINQKSAQLINFLRNKEKLFLNQSIKNSNYINKLIKYNLLNNKVDYNYLKEFSNEESKTILNLNIEKNDFENIYNRILKDNKFKFKHSFNQLSSNIVISLLSNFENWINNISIIKIKNGLNVLNKQKFITKSNLKLFISLLSKLKNDIKKLINNRLFDSKLPILSKVQKIYQQKRIKYFMQLLFNLNLSLNYIKLNNELKYPIDKNVQKELNKKIYYQYLNKNLSDQEINQSIVGLTYQLQNKLQILKDLKILTFYQKNKFEKLIDKMKNQIIQFNNLNNSLTQTYSKTTQFINQTIKFWNILIYYSLKSSKKINKSFLITQQKDSNENKNNYVRDEIITKLYSKLTNLKQENLLTISKYDTFVDKLKEQPLTKQLIYRLINDLNLLKLKQIVEFKHIHPNWAFYANGLIYKFQTSFNLIKQRYDIKQNELNDFYNKIQNELNKNFQNELKYLIYVSKFNSLLNKDNLTNQQKNRIEKELIIIIHQIQKYGKRSIKLEERLKYGFINYRKFEIITQNVIKKLKLKMQQIITNDQTEQKNNESFLMKNPDTLKGWKSNYLSETNNAILSIFNFNRLENTNSSNSVKKINLLKEINSKKLQKLMYFALNASNKNVIDQHNFEWDYFVLNFFKKEFQLTQLLNICQHIEKYYTSLNELRNQTKTKITAQTSQVYGNFIQQKRKNKISTNSEKSLTKNKKNIVQTFKIYLIKEFLLEMKKLISNSFNQTNGMKLSNNSLQLVDTFITSLNFENIENYLTYKATGKNISLQSSQFKILTLEKYFKKLDFNLHFSILNTLDFKKHAFKISQNILSNNSDTILTFSSLELKLLNKKFYTITKQLQKSYKFKILFNYQNENTKLFNINRIEKFEYYGLYSLKTKKLQQNQKIQERYTKLENIFMASNYTNTSLILQYLQFEINLLKKYQSDQHFNSYITNFLSFLLTKLNNFKNQSINISNNNYKKIKSFVLKTVLLDILTSQNLINLKNLVQTDLISNKFSNKIKQIYYRKKFIIRLQNILSKLKQKSFNDIYPFNDIFPKILLILDQINDLKIFNLIRKNQYTFLQGKIQQILEYEQYISRLGRLKKQGIINEIQYNQIFLKIQQKVVQKIREQKIVQKFKQYIQYLNQTNKNNDLSKNKNIEFKSLNDQYKKIISLNQGKWALVVIKEFYKQNLLTTSQYNEIIQNIEKNIRKKIQITKLFSLNNNLSKFKLLTKYKTGLTRKQNQKNIKFLKSLPKTWTKNVLKELRKQANISNQTFANLEKHFVDNNYPKTKEIKINDFFKEFSRNENQVIRKSNYNSSKNKIKQNLKLLKRSIDALLTYKKQLLNLLSRLETISVNSSSSFDLGFLVALKNNEHISQKEYNKLKMYNNLAKNRLVKLRLLQNSQSLNLNQYEKIYQKIIKSYLIIQYQYIQRLIRKKQSILQEISIVNKKTIDKNRKRHLNKKTIYKKSIKTSNSLYPLIQEVVSQLPIGTTNKNQSNNRQRIIYNRLYSKLRYDEVLIKKWKQILTTIFRKQLTPPLDIPPHLELKRLQISVVPINQERKSKQNVIIPVGTVISLPSRKTVGVSVLERLIVEYYSRN